MTTKQFINFCRINYLEGVNNCLAQGVDVNSKEIKDGRQETALMVACRADNPDIVERLLQVPELDINYQDEDGDTAAHGASINGQTWCIRMMAKTGRVDWNIRDKYGRTPLTYALS